jgi:xylulokinase
MKVLGFDVGSSSVKAGVLHNRKIVGPLTRASFATRYDGASAEVAAHDVLRAVSSAIEQLGPRAKSVDVIAMTVMAPSWLAMDRAGRPITPVVTHQDRRSVEQANQLIARFGKAKLLKLSGNLPFPGGISSTTWLWFQQNHKQLMTRAELVGNLQTYLHYQLNGARAMDPSNASFTGLYDTVAQRGWNEQLCAAVGASEHQLPQLIEAEGVVGMVTRGAGQRFGLTHGTPMLMGCMDTSAAMIFAKPRAGQLLDVCGSTDVLALCTDKPTPHERLLTRALGMGKWWLSVSTLAAAGSALSWAKDQLYADAPIEKFHALVKELAKDSAGEAGDVTFDPYLAGDRTSIEQSRGAFGGLTLSTTRRQMLAAVIESLARASAARIKLLATNPIKIRRQVVLSGGTTAGLSDLLHRDWPGNWTFKLESEATLKGLAALARG